MAKNTYGKGKRGLWDNGEICFRSAEKLLKNSASAVVEVIATSHSDYDQISLVFNCGIGSVLLPYKAILLASIFFLYFFTIQKLPVSFFLSSFFCGVLLLSTL